MEHEGRKKSNLYIDFRSNQPKNEATRTAFRDALQKSFEQSLPEAVERVWELPIIALPMSEQLYLGLLLETRELYVNGYFYSCVAMCGIVGERLVKDALRASLRVAWRAVGAEEETFSKPSGRAFDQLERVDNSALVRFLKEVGFLSEEAARAAISLIELRNKYAHARGSALQSDALDGIKYLHALVENTYSLFKIYDIRDGVFVAKTLPEPGADPSTPLPR